MKVFARLFGALGMDVALARYRKRSHRISAAREEAFRDCQLKYAANEHACGLGHPLPFPELERDETEARARRFAED